MCGEELDHSPSLYETIHVADGEAAFGVCGGENLEQMLLFRRTDEKNAASLDFLRTHGADEKRLSPADQLTED